MRIENDFIGEVKIPKNALYGINSVRAKNNFPFPSAFHKEWYRAVGLVKHACYNTVIKFKNTASKKIDLNTLPIKITPDNVLQKLAISAKEVANGDHFESFIIPAVQGGAGTSINLNINEIIANLSIEKLGGNLGDYSIVDPFEDANIYQSTNDVIPSALKIATMELLFDLEDSINDLRKVIERLESDYRNSLRIGYTQLQEAVPSTFGKMFSSFNEALSRDWWRVSKSFERIKTINMGGGAIGTSVSIPRFFVMEVVPELQRLTKMPITRSENLNDTTSNADSFVEVHAILKSHAVNIEKMVNDIRLLASDFSGTPVIKIPKVQVGSSIMPGKVNPVIPEFAISAVHKVYANDVLISSLCGLGNFDLNAYIPEIGNAILESIKLLTAVNKSLLQNLFSGIEINSELAEAKLFSSPSITTSLIPYIGYKSATQLSLYMKENNVDVFAANDKLGILESDKLNQIMTPANIMKQGFSVFDI